MFEEKWKKHLHYLRSFLVTVLVDQIHVRLLLTITLPLKISLFEQLFD